MITIADVASAASTSATTVSRVLSGRGDAFRISAATQQAVRRAAEKLSYRPSHLARSLKSGSSRTIGLLFNSNDLARPSSQAYAAAYLGPIDRAVRRAGYNLLLISDRQEYGVLEAGADSLADRRVDALIVFGYLFTRYIAKKLPLALGPDLPIAVIDTREELTFPTAVVDPAPGIAEAVRHCAGLGHRRLAWINSSTDRVRGAAFAAACESAGVHGTQVELGPCSQTEASRAEAIAAVAAAAASHFAEFQDATALLCYNDLTAFGVHAVLRDRGLQVPRDRSLIGFDDFYADLALPPLTTVRMPLDAVGSEVVRMALVMAEDPAAIPRLARAATRIPSSLVLRASTAPPVGA